MKEKCPMIHIFGITYNCDSNYDCISDVYGEITGGNSCGNEEVIIIRNNKVDRFTGFYAIHKHLWYCKPIKGDVVMFRCDAEQSDRFDKKVEIDDGTFFYRFCMKK